MATRFELENNVVSALRLRDYEQLFFGTNQEGGYDRPFLEFTSDTVAQNLREDFVTYFHYPDSTTTIGLSDSRLIQNGACAGPIPYKADRISQKNANYKKHIYWGDSSEPQSGRWLCAWLSAGYPDQDPIWIDRWYNPMFIDASGSFQFSTSAVYDTPSVLNLDPGVWYKYFHIGNDYNQHLVNLLSGNLSALKVHLDDWTYPITTDLSPYTNNAILINGIQLRPSVLESSTDNALFVSGNGFYGEVVFDDSFNINDEISVSCWVRVSDWSNAKGQHILSKSFRGGWALGYNPGFYNPIFTTFASGGDGFILNEAGKIQTLKDLPTPSSPANVYTDSQLFTWILDVYPTNKRLYKMDFDGTILLEKIFGDDIGITTFAPGDGETIYVYESGLGAISGFDSDGDVISTQTNIAGWNDITIDLNDTVRGTTENDICIDNDNEIWEALTLGGIRKTFLSDPLSGSITSYEGITAQTIDCDAQGDIWFTYGNNSFARIDSLTYDTQVSSTVGSVEIGDTREFALTREYIDSHWQDFGWFTYKNSQLIYKTDNRGNVVKTIKLLPYDISPIIPNFTSYDWNRKFNYIANDLQPQVELDIFLGTTTAPVCGITTLSFPATTLANDEWHLLSFTYNTTGDVKLFADSVERDSASVPDSLIYYDFENSLFIGTNAGKIQPLDKELGGINLYYEGYIDDVRIYDTALIDWDFWFIHNNKRVYEDIIWNMETGSQAYLEEIERFFKFKLPGLKSQFYNIRLTGLNITNIEVREIIEGIIKETVSRVAPAHTKLYKIIWE